MAVHYCNANKKLYVADTYNHKIKIISSSNLIEDFVGKVSET